MHSAIAFPHRGPSNLDAFAKDFVLDQLIRSQSFVLSSIDVRADRFSIADLLINPVLIFFLLDLSSQFIGIVSGSSDSNGLGVVNVFFGL